jgi:hypothetical protein
VTRVARIAQLSAPPSLPAKSEFFLVWQYCHTRKNHRFAGSDVGGARWATLCSLVETCKMNGVEPYAYLRDVLQRMVDGHPVNRLGELLPWNWKPAEAVKS